jgi:hypothetical protein
MDIYQHRCGLQRTLHKLRAGALTIGYIGGSITDGRVPHNWPEPVTSWFVEHFPAARVQVENAGIGATGSDLAVFRAERDLIARGCDLVFIEFAVNDGGEPPLKRRRTREGLIRKLLAGEGRDLVLVYTFSQDMYADMAAERVPASVAEFEELGAHYGIGSVWMGLHALREVQAGRLRWQEWLPDGLHPQYRGSLSYAQSVIAYLERELCTAPDAPPLPTGDQLPAPLDPLNWERATQVPFAAVKLQGPWVVRRWLGMPWMDLVLDTAAPGARLAFNFTGRVLTLGFDFGKNSAEFRYRLDGGDWVTVTRDRPVWCGPEGWYRLTPIAGDLLAAEHKVELEVLHGDRAECTGTDFRLALIGIVP